MFQSLQAKLSFSSKEIVALSCAWCKLSYHNKESCFNPERIGEECVLGKFISFLIVLLFIIIRIFYHTSISLYNIAAQNLTFHFLILSIKVYVRYNASVCILKCRKFSFLFANNYTGKKTPLGI